jgi:hypothetical protein
MHYDSYRYTKQEHQKVLSVALHVHACHSQGIIDTIEEMTTGQDPIDALSGDNAAILLACLNNLSAGETSFTGARIGSFIYKKLLSLVDLRHRLSSTFLVYLTTGQFERAIETTSRVISRGS